MGETTTLAAHVLLVEDQLLVAEIFREALEDRGHRVTSMPDGLAALAADRADPAEVLVTDLHMPGMGGLELLARLRERRPRLPAVVVSGYAAEAVAAGRTGTGETVVLGKPVSPRELAARVAALLDGVRRAG